MWFDRPERNTFTSGIQNNFVCSSLSRLEKRACAVHRPERNTSASGLTYDPVTSLHSCEPQWETDEHELFQRLLDFLCDSSARSLLALVRAQEMEPTASSSRARDFAHFDSSSPFEGTQEPMVLLSPSLNSAVFTFRISASKPTGILASQLSFPSISLGHHCLGIQRATKPKGLRAQLSSLLSLRKGRAVAFLSLRDSSLHKFL